MDEYLCLTVVSAPGEREAEFNSRLIAFWTRMLRDRPDDYERVYAETTRFGAADGCVTRQYLLEEAVSGTLTAELTAAGIDFQPPDPDEVYSRYEASSPEWFQIEH